MKMALFAAAAMIATPLVAQMTPATPDQTTPAPMASPMPTASPDASMAPAPMATPDATTPAPTASTGPLPWCKKGQFSGCREHETKTGEGLSKS